MFLKKTSILIKVIMFSFFAALGTETRSYTR